jgi:biopolymer transport protein ExbB/TolQ
MPDHTLKCPECGAPHHLELIRCPTCHAYTVDANPWRSDSNLLAVPLALLIWAGMLLILNQPWAPARDIFSDSISQVILGLAVYGLLIVAFKWQVTQRQDKGFRLIRGIAANNELSADTLDTATNAVDSSGLGAYNRLIAFQRLRWICDAAAVPPEERSTLLEAMRQHAATEWDSLDSSFSSVQFLIWLLPTAGFLGTVYGMTQALKSFSDVVASGSELTFTAGLTQTAQNLGIAFHTTLVGLACVIPLLAMATMFRRRSNTLLENMDKFFVRLAAERKEVAVVTAAPKVHEPTVHDRLLAAATELSTAPVVAEAEAAAQEAEPVPAGQVADPIVIEPEPEPVAEPEDASTEPASEAEPDESVAAAEADETPVDPEANENVAAETTTAGDPAATEPSAADSDDAALPDPRPA